jgi:trehalose-6-phosphate synthase
MTSLEYVVCQRGAYGPLILLEISGTAGSLRDAIYINPVDISDMAKQINDALTMSKRSVWSCNRHCTIMSPHTMSKLGSRNASASS